MLKNKLEALLFSSGRKMNVEELSKLSHAQTDEVQSALTELKKECDEKNSSIMIVNEGSSWKLTVREQFLSLVQKIVTETELSKTIMETLAVIAFKYPIKQSDLIKIRTNKAYDHLKELEEMGYITRQKHGRTNLIKLTERFFEYFDLPEEKLKEKFKDFRSIAEAIEGKEKEIETIRQEQKAKAEEEKQKDAEIKKEVDSVDNDFSLEKYGNKEQTKDERPKTEIVEDKLGNLEVVDEPSEEELEKERERIEEIKEEDRKIEEEKKEEQKPKFEGKGIKLSKEEEKIVDEKVEKILHPPKESQEGQNETQEAENKSEEEPKDLLDVSMKENKKEKK